MDPSLAEALRSLPQVDRLLSEPAIAGLLDRVPRSALLRSVRLVLAGLREDVKAGRAAPPFEPARLLPGILAALEGDASRGLRRVVNATGEVLHPGLGRAALPPDALAALREEARGYCLLAIDRETSARAVRYRFCEALLRDLTGAEAACVVNNGAAAVMLLLDTTAGGGEVVVSRGQVVEIGGDFRIADVVRRSGATLVEAGAANRTRLADYEAAITERTRLILRVRVAGGAGEVPIGEIADLGRRRGVLVADDLGAGALLDLRSPGGPEEPLVADSVRAGADLVTFSADKLVGGPQAGIILGRRDLVERLHDNPLYRALRVGKLTLIALEATLRTLFDRKRALAGHPATRMLSTPLPELDRRAREIAAGLAGAPGAAVEVRPAREASGFVVAVTPAAGGAEALARALRLRPVAVVARLDGGALLLDPRTVLPEETSELAAAVRAALSSG